MAWSPTTNGVSLPLWNLLSLVLLAAFLPAFWSSELQPGSPTGLSHSILGLLLQLAFLNFSKLLPQDNSSHFWTTWSGNITEMISIVEPKYVLVTFSTLKCNIQQWQVKVLLLLLFCLFVYFGSQSVEVSVHSHLASRKVGMVKGFGRGETVQGMAVRSRQWSGEGDTLLHTMPTVTHLLPDLISQITFTYLTSIINVWVQESSGGFLDISHHM